MRMGVEDRWMCIAARIAESGKASAKREVAAELLAPCNGTVAGRFQIRALNTEIRPATVPSRSDRICTKSTSKASSIGVVSPDLFA